MNKRPLFSSITPQTAPTPFYLFPKRLTDKNMRYQMNGQKTAKGKAWVIDLGNCIVQKQISPKNFRCHLNICEQSSKLVGTNLIFWQGSQLTWQMILTLAIFTVEINCNIDQNFSPKVLFLISFTNFLQFFILFWQEYWWPGRWSYSEPTKGGISGADVKEQLWDSPSF